MKSKMPNLLFLAIIIFLTSFPKIDPTFSTGLDFSLPFALNYFFSHDIHFGSEVIFTYGPLSFLKMPVPMGNNLVLSIGFISIVYLTFIYATLFLGQLINKEKWLLHFGIVFLLCQIVNVDHLLIGITAVSLLIHHEAKSRKWLIVSLFSLVFGLYIKSSIGISSFLLLISYMFIYYFLYKDFKKLIKIVVSVGALYFLFWFVIYRDFHGCLKFLWATFQLAKDNSAAASVYPENNWWLLGTALVAFFLIPAVTKDKRTYFLYVLFFLSAFASWKHSYSREEEVHLSVFYHFLILFFFVFLIFIDKIKLIHIILIIVSFFFLYSNMLSTERYHQDDRIGINGFNNFYETFFDYGKLAEKSAAISKENIQPAKLPMAVLSIIGNESVDVYPWDFSYVVANNLNWKPRPVIQSYAAYTEWLDNQDAEYFSSDKSARYIVWELTDDRYGQKGFCSIDNRYLLNDEPHAIYQFFTNYKPVYKNEQIILFAKTNKRMLFYPKSIKSDTASWNQWIKVPPAEDGIVRVKTKFNNTFFGQIKEFLFKGEEIRMDCRMKNGNVMQYRVIPNCAERGIWINPLLASDMDKSTIQFSEVDVIRFTCSNINLMKSRIFMEWENIEINKEHIAFPDSSATKLYSGNYKNTFNYFMQYYVSADTLIVHSLNDFESKKENWSGDTTNLSSENIFSGKKSELLDAKDIYSSTFTFSISKIRNDSSAVIVNTSVWVKMAEHARGTLVVSLEDNGGIFFWKARKLEDYVNDRNEWQQVFFKEKFTSISNDAKLSIYIINDNKKEICIDDFDVKVYKSD
ncbi:MAG: hypothetical protein HY841_01255 [Bacteroidetes bacterium]|nr:hypothetical protein [Bacteroidota bacterium]